MSETELSEPTSRQRRNLIAVCTIIIFIEFAQVDFGSPLRLFGTSFVIGNPDFVYTLLYLAVAYFGWRYYLYFASDRAHHKILMEYRSHIEAVTRQKIVSLICKPNGLRGLAGDYSYEHLDKADFPTYRIEANPSGDPAKYDADGNQIEPEIFIAEISALAVEFSRLLATVLFAVRSRVVSDYIVPYLFAFFVIYLAFRDGI